MRTYISFAILFSMMLLTVSCLQAQTKTEQAIKGTLMDYIEGTNKQDAERVADSFTKNTVIFVARKEQEAITFPASFFVKRVESGQSGGDERSVDIESIHSMDNLAASARVKAVTKDNKTHYDHIISLVNDNGKWVITSVIIHIEGL